MGILYPLVLLFLPFMTFYFELAVSAETTLDANCTIPIQCIDTNSTCINFKCKCLDDFYRDSKSGCTPYIHPHRRCGNFNPKDSSCVTNGYCNATDFCVCCTNFIATFNSCIEASTVQATGQTTVFTSTQRSTTKQIGIEVSHLSGSTVQTTDFNTTTDNSSATTVVVEISAIILCFLLELFSVSK